MADLQEKIDSDLERYKVAFDYENAITEQEKAYRIFMEDLYRFKYLVRPDDEDDADDEDDDEDFGERPPEILKAPNIFDVAKDDLPSNFTDSELLLDAYVRDNLAILEGQKSNESLGTFTITSRYTLQEIDAIKQNINEKYKNKLNSTLAKDIENWQNRQNKMYYDMQQQLNREKGLTNDRMQINPNSASVYDDL